MPERIEITKMKQNSENREYVIENVKQEGALLEFASEELRDDKDVILEAIHNNPEALEFASDRLKADREVVYESVSKVGWTYCYAKENLLDDKDLYMTCLETVITDGNFKKLGVALEEKNVPEAFDYAHTLKGVFANLGLTPMFVIIEQIVEQLRSGSAYQLEQPYEALLEANENLKRILGM